MKFKEWTKIFMNKYREILLSDCHFCREEVQDKPEKDLMESSDDFMNNDGFWKIVNWVDWKYISQVDRSENLKKSFRAGMLEKYGQKKINQMFEIYQKKYRTLIEIMHTYDKQGKARVGDDGVWDLCAHIVGLGEEEYLKAISNPQNIVDRGANRDYVENFGYWIPNK